MFDQLSPDNIKTKILIDKVIPFVNFSKYDGTDSIGIISFKDWREIYSETNNATISDTLFQNLAATFKEAYRTKNDENVIPFGVINVKYNKLKDSALLKDLIYYQDGKLGSPIKENITLKIEGSSHVNHMIFLDIKIKWKNSITQIKLIFSHVVSLILSATFI